MIHSCIQKFETQKIDKCCGEGFNKCSGTAPMVLELWFAENDGSERFYDEWLFLEVNFCPFCGRKSKGEICDFEKESHA